MVSHRLYVSKRGISADYCFLMKRFSTRQLFISSMLFLLVGSIIAASSMNFPMMLTGRMIQAVGAGIIIPLMMTVIVYLYPVEQRGQ